ncbi:ATP-grasp fold amidoligase family protein [Nesterenkonia halobia]|uniref:ATP-grasp domain-containing protein n=1 Tax=Nesterenkonia halobia TaxID=37922 RepID=A0ABP6RIP2_9MICC
MSRIPDAVRRRIPPLARRDRRIARLESDLARARRLRDAADVRLDHARTELTRVRAETEEEIDRIGRHAAQETSRLREAMNLQRRQARRTRATLDRETRDVERLGRELEQTEERRKDFETRLRHPSFRTRLSASLAALSLSRDRSWHDSSTQAQLTVKLRNYALAQSHGIAVPTVHAVWDSPEAVDLSGIDAERLVLKADRGHSGRAVIPLERDADGWHTLDGAETLVDGRPTSQMIDRLRSGGAGPYFAEQFLASETGETLPADIKVYTCYGEILQVLVMQTDGVDAHERGAFTRRYFDADGESLGRVLPRVTLSSDMPRPEPWEELLDAARRLSVAVGRPFVRVDLYTTDRGPVLGELTPTPGGIQLYRLDHDLAMGAAWADAEVRLERDVACGRPVGTLFGEHEYTWWYDAVAGDGGPEDPSTWPRRQACAEVPYTPPRVEDRATILPTADDSEDGREASAGDAVSPGASPGDDGPARR